MSPTDSPTRACVVCAVPIEKAFGYMKAGDLEFGDGPQTTPVRELCGRCVWLWQWTEQGDLEPLKNEFTDIMGIDNYVRTKGAHLVIGGHGIGREGAVRPEADLPARTASHGRAGSPARNHLVQTGGGHPVSDGRPGHVATVGTNRRACMNRPVPYIDLFGVAAIRKRFGLGWAVGMPRLRTRHGKPAVELRQISYHTDVDEAVEKALTRLRAHDLLLGYPPTPEGPENEVARLLASFTGVLIDHVPDIIRAGRLAAGLSRAELARCSYVERSTVYRTERRLTETKLHTAYNLLRNLPR